MTAPYRTPGSDEGDRARSVTACPGLGGGRRRCGQAAESRRVVGEGLGPRPHWLAGRERARLEHAPAWRRRGTGPGRRWDILGGDLDPGQAEHLPAPVSARDRAEIDVVVRPGDRAGADELDDRLGQVGGGRRRAVFVVDEPERIAARPGPERGRDDLGREVVAGRPVQPGRPNDRQRSTVAARERLAGRDLAVELAPAVCVRRRRRILGPIAAPVGPLPVEHLVGRHQDEIDPARRAADGQLVGRGRVSPAGQGRVARAAVDVGPGRRVDDDLGSIASDDPVCRTRVVEVVVGPGPGDRAGETGERCLGQGRDERSAEPPAGAGHRDPHLSRPRRSIRSRRRPATRPAALRTAARNRRPSRRP